MKELKGSISLSLIRNLPYCERMVWFKLNSDIEEPPTPSMILSSERHRDLKRIAESLMLPQPMQLNKKLCHPQIPVCGSPDIISGKERKIIVEYKHFSRERGDFQDFRAQLLTYGWLVQEVEGRVWKLVLMVGREVVWEQEYSYELHISARHLVERLLKILDSPTPPSASYGGKCSYCFFKSVCSSSNQPAEIL
ncbi:MAG: CRISPR-associated protein Cas4 [Fervidicoccaceae archaeon]